MAQRIWLDGLPEDIRENIAERVSSEREDQAALYLAQSSPIQRKAVLSVLRYSMTHDTLSKIDICDNTQVFYDWVSLFGQDLQHVMLPSLSIDSSTFRRMFSAPQLRSVEIFDHPDHLEAVTKFSVHKVILVPIGLVKPSALLKALPKIKAEQVSLELDVTTDSPNENRRWRALRAIVSTDVLSTCANLTSLELAGPPDLVKEAFDGGPIWNTITKISSLCELTLREDFGLTDGISDDVIRFLSGLDSLSLNGLAGRKLCSLPVESSLTQLHCFYCACRGLESSSQDLLHLARYTRLKRLSIIICAGVEKELVETVRALPDLQRLDLSRFRDPNRPYYAETAQLGEMLNAVRYAPNLKELCLGHASIPTSEIIAILEFTGTRLESFEVCLYDDEETPMERLIAVCQAASRCNTRLHTFLPRETANAKAMYLKEEDRRHYERDYEFAEDLTKRGLLAISMLRRLASRAPLLSAWASKVIQDIFAWMEANE